MTPELLPHAPQGHYAQANGLTIYYEEQGTGHPLILLHGGTLTHTCWRNQAPTWARHFRVISPDSRGHGRTDNPSGLFSYDLMADDMLAFIETLDLQKPVICGVSDGAYIALSMGERSADLAAAYVFHGGSYRMVLAGEPCLTFQRNLGIEGPERQTLGELELQSMERNRPDVVALLQERHQYVYGPEYWKTYLRAIWPMWQAPIEHSASDLRGIVAPSLVVVGDHDAYVPLEEAIELYRRLPVAELAVVPATEHSSFMRDRADAVTQVITDFLLRHVVTEGRHL
jgi:pimeloyl-ACP methyl ester carboxylesterase